MLSVKTVCSSSDRQPKGSEPLMIDDMQVYIANLGKYNEGELVGD